MPGSGEQLQLQRGALRRGLWRASLASVVVLLVVVALAGGVAWKAEQSRTQAERAFAASARAESELWNAKLSEARALRIAGGPGARVQSAALIRELVDRPDLPEGQLLALRLEAIAQLALVDVEPGTNWVPGARAYEIFWDETLTRYAKQEADSRIAVLSYPENQTVQVFETRTNAALQKAVFSPRGDLLAAQLRNDEVRVWRIQNAQLILSVRSSSDWRFDTPFFSPDGQTLGVIRGSGMRLYDLASSNLVRHFQIAPAVAAFSPDGQQLAVILGSQVKVLPLDRSLAGQAEASLTMDVEVNRVAWHPAGRQLAISGGNGRLLLWDVRSDAKARELDGHPSRIMRLAFAPDGSMLVTYAWDSISSFWEPLSGRRLLAEDRVGIAGFGATGDKVQTFIERPSRAAVQRLFGRTGFHTVASTGNRVELTQGVWIHPSGRLIASAYFDPGRVCIWRFPEGEKLGELPGRWAQFTADGSAIITISEGGPVIRFTIPANSSHCGHPTNWQKEVLYSGGGSGRIIRGTLAPDSRTMVVGEDPYVTLLDLAGEREPRRFATPAQNGSLSPDGRWLVTEKHQTYGYVLDAVTGERVLRLPERIRAEFSPDGRYLIVADENALSLHETNSWKVARTIPLEVGAGNSPAFVFSPDGQMLALAYNRRDVKLLETTSGRELATFSAPSPAPISGLRGLAFTGDLRWLLAAPQDGDIVAWELPVVRAELAKLGLDWANTRLGRANVSASFGSRGRPPSQVISAPMAALLAALFAIAAGTFIFLMQRRMLTGYEHVESVALEQRGKLAAAREELMQGQKMQALGTLAAGIAHDFNNLLSVIRLSNDFLRRGVKGDPDLAEETEAISRAVHQGKSVVNSMLGYTRSQKDDRAPVDVCELVEDLVTMLSHQFLAGVQLTVDLDREAPTVEVPRSALQQVLLNLVVNACEAMKFHGKLRISVTVAELSDANGLVKSPRSAAAYILLTVADSGPGMTPDIQSRIFEPFFTTKQIGASPGRGLGLSTVYAVAGQEGLGLGLQTAPQQGAVFQVFIPCASIAHC